MKKTQQESDDLTQHIVCGELLEDCAMAMGQFLSSLSAKGIREVPAMILKTFQIGFEAAKVSSQGNNQAPKVSDQPDELSRKITWKDNNGKYVNGKSAYLGKILVGSVFYDGISPAHVEYRYKAALALPQIKQPNNNYATEEQAMSAVHERIEGWMKAAGVKYVD